MKRFLLLAMVALSCSIVADSAHAQGYHNGYAFGLGVNNSFPVIGQSYFSREDVPYFAKFPPVYYSHIVRRPYGVSPYAAPACIAPIELSIPAIEPQVIVNPHVAPETPIRPNVPNHGDIAPIAPGADTTPMIDADSKNLSRTDSLELPDAKPESKPANKKKAPKKK